MPAPKWRSPSLLPPGGGVAATAAARNQLQLPSMGQQPSREEQDRLLEIYAERGLNMELRRILRQLMATERGMDGIHAARWRACVAHAQQLEDEEAAIRARLGACCMLTVPIQVPASTCSHQGSGTFSSCCDGCAGTATPPAPFTPAS